ncbi:YkgJ family cysteine cluster protein [Alteraurantiacibacter buctensis]|uniref:YkgJ family cysteine cluster protein n=1 Tax=Alteraurantiacibacter buctensis TaxID=1503981 RepID=A0A844YYI4_9SPHN|nr:hypothetical protein [Alteraurantiacibacter buctensis]MXO70793.1 hypothetical protein [Alteraurantiacibacter buctensis]
MASTNICVACGICCDGHLFDHARMYPGEQPLCASLGMGTEERDDGEGRFLLPCPRHGAEGCTVYDRRPTTCRTFRCRLLKDHEAGAISGDEALAVIGKVHALDWHGTLRPLLLRLVPDQAGPVTRHLLAAQAAIAADPDPAAQRRTHAQALLRTTALVELLRQYFYKRPEEDPAARE